VLRRMVWVSFRFRLRGVTDFFCCIDYYGNR
jgi:hypothetical protein